jgi:hypothetical protein
VNLMAQAVAAASRDTGADLADWMENLGLVLRDRYFRDGDLADLDLAAARLAAAIRLTPADAVARPGRLDHYATTLRLRALRGGDPADLRRAVNLHREAARLAVGAPELGVVLNNLGGTLRAWARATDDQRALSEALRAYQEALGYVQAAERGGVLTNLGSALLDSYDRTGERRDLMRRSMRSPGLSRGQIQTQRNYRRAWTTWRTGCAAAMNATARRRMRTRRWPRTAEDSGWACRWQQRPRCAAG